MGMRLQCNIDSKGRAARLVYGVVVLLGGIAAAVFWARTAGSVWAWVVAASLVAAGAFAIFEARAGWCVVRAMGFKTPI
jgi:hypothetical protein